MRVLLSTTTFLFLVKKAVPSITRRQGVKQMRQQTSHGFVERGFSGTVTRCRATVEHRGSRTNRTTLRLGATHLCFVMERCNHTSRRCSGTVDLHPSLLKMSSIYSCISTLHFRKRTHGTRTVYLSGTCGSVCDHCRHCRGALRTLTVHRSIRRSPKFSTGHLLLGASGTRF